jgi:guanine deaminase
VTVPSAPELDARVARPPFSVRAQLLTPLAAGGSRFESDCLMRVDRGGRISHVGPWRPTDGGNGDGRNGDGGSGDGDGTDAGRIVDLRPLLLMPGLIDLHAHLPQLPSAGLGAGLDLLTWLERYIFPLERRFDEAEAGRLAPAAFRALAAAGTTTAVLYGAVYEPSLDACFRAAEEHGIRAVIGKVMMDRLRYDARVEDSEVLELSLRQTADLISRWHGRDDGRLQYAVTPRFAVSCSMEMLRESAALAASTGAYWQTHLSEDSGEVAEVARLFPEARDYLDVYDRAGALGARTILAHAIHLSPREVDRLVEADARVAHCPASNLFLSSGMMPLGAFRAAGMTIGLGSDVAAGPELSMFSVMRAGAATQRVLELIGRGDVSGGGLRPLDWLRIGTLDGARALGLAHEIGSLEVGKEADLIAVDPRITDPLPTDDPPSAADEIASRLVFRQHPNMVRAAWVRGRLLAGPPGVDDIG